MTDLEYMICEAESNGEIDLDTRDELLGILYESISLQRNYDSVKKDIVNTKAELNKEINRLQKKYEAKKKISDALLDKSKKYEVTDSKLADIMVDYKERKRDTDEAYDDLVKMKEHYKNVCKENGKKLSDYNVKDARTTLTSTKDADKKVKDAINQKKRKNIKDYKQLGQKKKNNIKDTFYRDDRRGMDKRLDKYEVESVDVDDIRMEIYERELTGEITVEEREELLDYLDSQLIED